MRRSLLVVLVVACFAVAQAQIGQIGRPLGGLPQPVTSQIGAVGSLAAQQPALIPQQQFGGLGVGVQQPFTGIGAGVQQPFVQQPMQFGSGLPLGGAAVLPQNFQQPIAGQLNLPVLSPQQAAQLIPIDQMQAALNQRVAASGQLGVMPPAQGLPLATGGVGIQQVQQPFAGVQQPFAQQPFAGVQQPFAQQQQLPMQFGSGVGVAQGQIPYPAAFNTPFQQTMPMGVAQQQPFAMGVGAFPQQQQQGLQLPTMGQTQGLPNIGSMQMPQMPTIGGL